MNNKRLLLIISFVICILLSISCVGAGGFEFKEDAAEIDNDVVNDDEASDNVTFLDFMNVTPFSEDTIVSIGGIDFNIPEGFGENLNLAKDSDSNNSLSNNKNITSFTRVFMNEENMIIIDVLYNDAQSVEIEDFTLEPDEVEKTISGEKGIFHENNEKDYCDFTYCSDGKVIVIGADNEKLISDVIV